MNGNGINGNGVNGNGRAKKIPLRSEAVLCAAPGAYVVAFDRNLGYASSLPSFFLASGFPFFAALRYHMSAFFLSFSTPYPHS